MWSGVVSEHLTNSLSSQDIWGAGEFAHMWVLAQRSYLTAFLGQCPIGSMKCLACCYGPLCPCTTIARAWFILPTVRQFHFWWVFDSVRPPFVMIVLWICSYSQVVEGLHLGGLRILSLLLWTMWFCRLGDLQLVLKRFTGWDPTFYSFGSSICSLQHSPLFLLLSQQ